MVDHRRDITESTRLILGMLPDEFKALSREDLLKLGKNIKGNVVGLSFRTAFAYDPQTGCEVGFVEYAGLTVEEGTRAHYGVGLFWQDPSIPQVEIDLDNNEVWVQSSAGSKEHKRVQKDDIEVRSRTLGALACLADSLF